MLLVGRLRIGSFQRRLLGQKLGKSRRRQSPVHRDDCEEEEEEPRSWAVAWLVVDDGSLADEEMVDKIRRDKLLLEILVWAVARDNG